MLCFEADLGLLCGLPVTSCVALGRLISSLSLCLHHKTEEVILPTLNGRWAGSMKWNSMSPFFSLLQPHLPKNGSASSIPCRMVVWGSERPSKVRNSPHGQAGRPLESEVGQRWSFALREAGGHSQPPFPGRGFREKEGMVFPCRTGMGLCLDFASTLW